MSSPLDVVFLILSQVATKGFTFVSNQLLLQNISPEVFGVAAYLEFTVNTVLFFTREAERLAVQRAKASPQVTQIITNFAYLPVALCVPMFVVFYLLQKNSDLFVNTIAPLAHVSWTLAAVVLLVVVELAAEPLFALKQYSLDFKTRSKVESMAVLAKCATTFAGVIACKKLASENAQLAQDFDSYAVLSFALGQLAYAAVTLVGFWVSSLKFPVFKSIPNKGKPTYFDSTLFLLWKLLSFQMVFKHILTEGDHLLISYIFTASQQGVYSVIANYGSIVARLLFLPIEEWLRVSFSKRFSEKNVDYQASYKLLQTILVLYFDLCLVLVLGGVTNGAFLIRIVLGGNEKWKDSSVFHHFPQYVQYIPFMAINGILEAFFSSASTEKQITKFSLFMSVLSVAILALSYLLVETLQMGITGLILANMANMSLRIVYCLFFFTEFWKGKTNTKGNTLSRLALPLCLVIGAYAVQYQLYGGESSSYKQLMQSVVLCGLCTVGILANERRAILQLAGRGIKSKTE